MFMNYALFMKKIFFSLLLFLAAIAAHATVLTTENREVNLIDSAQFMEDPSGVLRIDDVRNMDDRFASWTRGGTELNFGFTDSAYWIRVPLQRAANAPKDWLLVTKNAKLYELDFYLSDAPAILTGSSRAFATRPYFDRFFVLPLDVQPQPQFAYLRVTSRYALTVPLAVWQPDAYRQEQQQFQSLQFIYYGGLIVLAMYGLVIFLALRDQRFLTYCAYIVTIWLGMFASNGYGRQLVWPDALDFDEVAQSVFFNLAAFFAVRFARNLLLRATDRSWLKWCLQWSEFIFLLTSLLALLAIAYPELLRPANQLLLINSVLMGLWVTVASVRAYLQKRPGIRFFLAGWFMLWLGVSVAALRAFGWLPSTGLTSYAVQISTTMEVLLMALALGDLLRLEHEAHRHTQAQALAANRAMLEMTQASEDKLKHAVQERTEQLEASLLLEKSLREQYVRFGSMISHEFRTPLSIIQSQASLMRKEHEHAIDQVTKRLGAISSASQRLTVMFDKWLQSDAMTQTLEALDPKQLELQPWLNAVIKTSTHLLLNHTVKLHLHPEVNTVLVDEYHLGVALTNLIDNAAKYSSTGTSITVGTRLKAGYVGIAVTDLGPGIPQDVQEKVFAEFFRLSPESGVRGVGLGLSIVQRIAHAHGGHVALSSTAGHGSTFCIWLPTPQTEEPL